MLALLRPFPSQLVPPMTAVATLVSGHVGAAGEQRHCMQGGICPGTSQGLKLPVDAVLSVEFLELHFLSTTFVDVADVLARIVWDPRDLLIIVSSSPITNSIIQTLVPLPMKPLPYTSPLHPLCDKGKTLDTRNSLLPPPEEEEEARETPDTYVQPRRPMS